MIRKNIVSWQWSDYTVKHQNQMNILLHSIGVPMSWAALLFLVKYFLTGSLYLLLVSPLCFILSMTLQGIGHKMEKLSPAPITNIVDFLSRFLIEQYINYPRFILSGKWIKLP